MIHLWVLVHAAGPEKTPWGTHAYIISAHLAERMALLAKLMVERSKMPVPSVTVQGEPYWFHTTSWVLDGEDMKIDHFLSLVYDSLTPRSDKSRCANRAHLARLGLSLRP